MTEKKFKFVPRKCFCENTPKVCPIESGSEFMARLDGKDEYRIYRSLDGDHPGAGKYFAGCPHCHSHGLVEELK